MNLNNHFSTHLYSRLKISNDTLPDPAANTPFTEVDVVGGSVSVSSSDSSSSSVCPT